MDYFEQLTQYRNGSMLGLGYFIGYGSSEEKLEHHGNVCGMHNPTDKSCGESVLTQLAADLSQVVQTLVPQE